MILTAHSPNVQQAASYVSKVVFDGSEISVRDNDVSYSAPHIYMLNTNTGKVQVLNRAKVGLYSPVFVNQNTILYGSDGSKGIISLWEQNLDTKKVKLLTKVPGFKMGDGDMWLSVRSYDNGRWIAVCDTESWGGATYKDGFYEAQDSGYLHVVILKDGKSWFKGQHIRDFCVNTDLGTVTYIPSGTHTLKVSNGNTAKTFSDVFLPTTVLKALLPMKNGELLVAAQEIYKNKSSDPDLNNRYDSTFAIYKLDRQFKIESRHQYEVFGSKSLLMGSYPDFDYGFTDLSLHLSTQLTMDGSNNLLVKGSNSSNIGAPATWLLGPQYNRIMPYCPGWYIGRDKFGNMLAWVQTAFRPLTPSTGGNLEVSSIAIIRDIRKDGTYLTPNHVDVGDISVWTTTTAPSDKATDPIGLRIQQRELQKSGNVSAASSSHIIEN